MVIKNVYNAADAFSYLRGFFCVYKPACYSIRRCVEVVKGQLSGELNTLEQRPLFNTVHIKGDITPNDAPMEVVVRPSYADHPLAVGPRYQEQNIRLYAVFHPPFVASGVTLLGISPNIPLCKFIQQSGLMRTYHIDCELGIGSDDQLKSGKLVERGGYRHITPGLVERLLSSIQALHQKQAFNYAGVQPDSQEAFELASKGLVRPEGRTPPLLYSIKCLSLELPKMTLEMQILNEDADFMKVLIQDIGHRLRSCAVVDKMRLVRFGPFTSELALLRRHWRLQDILNNIYKTGVLLDELKYPALLQDRRDDQRTLQVRLVK